MTSSDEHLKRGIAAYKQGRKQAAGQYIKEAIQLDPKNEKAWLWLSGIVESHEQRRDCLQRVLAINPDNRTARLGLEKLTVESQKAIRPNSPPPSPLSLPSESAPIEWESTTLLELEPIIPESESVPVSTSSFLTTSESAEVEKEQVDDLIESVAVKYEKEKAGSRLTIILGIGVIVILIAWTAYFFTTRPQAGPILMDLIIQLLPSDPYSSEEETAVLQAIYENIAAANSENIDRYMTSLHTQSPRFNNTRERLEALYSDYDLAVTIYDLEIYHYTPEEVRVSFWQETRSREGPDFPDNLIYGTIILRPENGEWKLFDQLVKEREELEG